MCRIGELLKFWRPTQTSFLVVFQKALNSLNLHYTDMQTKKFDTLAKKSLLLALLFLVESILVIP